MTTLGDMVSLMKDIGPVPQRRITCGVAVYSWIRHRPAPPLKPGTAAIEPMFGVPVVLDPRMPRGKWVCTEDGVEIACGQVGNGERVWYLPALDQFVTSGFGPLIDILDEAEQLP